MSDNGNGLEEGTEVPFDSDTGPGDDVAEEGAEGTDSTQEESKGGLWGLRNATPEVEPSQVGRQLDLDAEWHEHLTCGFIKQSGSEGAEAWMHYVMAVILLISEFSDVDITPEGPEETDTDQGTEQPFGDQEGPAQEEQFEGPQ